MGTPPHAASGHWYTVDGRPLHTLPVAAGGHRPTRLEDARALGLYPSVTGILKVIAKPGLEHWKMKQVALAAARGSQNPGEHEADFVQRILEAGFAAAGTARNLGSDIHRALERFWLDQVEIPDELQRYCGPVVTLLRRTVGTVLAAERVLMNHQHGFAGTVDLCVRTRRGNPAVFDYKARKTEPGKPVVWYDEHILQVAAYAATAFGEENLPKMHGANILISTNEPGRVEVKHYPPVELVQAFETFTLICELWRRVNHYDPRQPTQS